MRVIPKISKKIEGLLDSDLTTFKSKFTTANIVIDT